LQESDDSPTANRQH